MATQLFLGGGNSNIFYFHPEDWGRFSIWLTFFNWVETTNQFLFSSRFFGEIIHFDEHIFFNWVGEKPPTRNTVTNGSPDLCSPQFARLTRLMGRRSVAWTNLAGEQRCSKWWRFLCWDFFVKSTSRNEWVSWCDFWVVELEISLRMTCLLCGQSGCYTNVTSNEKWKISGRCLLPFISCFRCLSWWNIIVCLKYIGMAIAHLEYLWVFSICLGNILERWLFRECEVDVL